MQTVVYSDICKTPSQNRLNQKYCFHWLTFKMFQTNPRKGRSGTHWQLGSLKRCFTFLKHCFWSFLFKDQPQYFAVSADQDQWVEFLCQGEREAQKISASASWAWSVVSWWELPWVFSGRDVRQQFTSTSLTTLPIAKFIYQGIIWKPSRSLGKFQIYQIKLGGAFTQCTQSSLILSLILLPLDGLRFIEVKSLL